mgnify:CR=1 FL=1
MSDAEDDENEQINSNDSEEDETEDKKEHTFKAIVLVNSNQTVVN